MESKLTEAGISLSDDPDDPDSLGILGVVDNLPCDVFRRVLHPDGTITYPYVSWQAMSLFGFETSEIRQRPENFVGAMHPEDQADWRRAIEESARDLTPFDHEHRFINPDGKIVWAHALAIPRRMENGDVVWDGVAFNVTERKGLEVLLRDTRQELADIAANVPGDVYRRYLRPDGRITFSLVSSNIAEMLGMSPEVDEQDGGPFVDSIAPNDRPRWWAAVEQSIAKRQRFDIEFRIHLPDGETKWFRSITSPPRAQGDSFFWDGVTIDISTQKRAESALQQSEALLRHGAKLAGLGYWVWDEIEERSTYCSAELATLHGLTPAQYLERFPTHEAVLSVVHPDDREAYDQAVHQGEKDGSGYEVELRVLIGDEYRFLREISECVHDDRGRLVQTYGTLQDITAEKEAEARLRMAIEEAELASRSKSEFLANMSHELRTPLNAIMGFSELMTLEALGPIGNPSYSEYARDIFNSAEHLLSIINDILDLSKLDAERYDLDVEVVDLAASIRESVRVIKPRARVSRQTVEVDIEADAPPVLANTRAVKQVLMNLLSNAVKFTPDHGALTIRLVSEEGGLCVEVADTGVGISPEDLPHIFDPFIQVDSSMVRRHEGTGLGLALAKSLSERMGVELTIESEIGKGTVARLRFPRSKAVENGGLHGRAVD
ncbi:MAG: PAS domain-containing protein [Rhodospirillaceae bacterium]|nr:PAS domain-containing protein [Rhodospirillaceae bacterium]